ncbi:MAG: hypothetical protein J6R47_00215 [Acholeplasmatales bacterium]|nr:hypothetical protein [Acholeplasmatales bacterium]
MLKVSNIEIFNWEGAIRGMRNPLNSWHLSDTFIEKDKEYCTNELGIHYPEIGPNDYSLMKKLAKAGSDHRKYLRQIFISMDIDAPLFFWKECDTYKIGTVANSCSTMHKIHSKEFTRNDFSIETCDGSAGLVMDTLIRELNRLRDLYNETKDKKYWRQMIEMLPSSYNQLRTVTLNYEVAINMYRARRHHKLTEWHTLCDTLEKFPYSEFITLNFEDESNV